ncbi:MAG: hypothetical protein WC957_03550 [Candidatus Neomarinimicrobiota bacterium]|jgi:hypothetical protein
MGKERLANRADELEDLMIESQDFDIASVMSDEYRQLTRILKTLGSSYPYEQAIRMVDICELLEKKMPNIPKPVFEEYVIYQNLIAIILEEE